MFKGLFFAHEDSVLNFPRLIHIYSTYNKTKFCSFDIYFHLCSQEGFESWLHSSQHWDNLYIPGIPKKKCLQMAPFSAPASHLMMARQSLACWNWQGQGLCCFFAQHRVLAEKSEKPENNLNLKEKIQNIKKWYQAKKWYKILLQFLPVSFQHVWRSRSV